MWAKGFGHRELLVCEAVCSLGAGDGLLPGMRLYALENPGNQAEVMDVDQTRSIVEFRFPYVGSIELPTPGTLVSTHPGVRAPFY